MDAFAAHRIISKPWLDKTRIDLIALEREIDSAFSIDFSAAIRDRRLISDIEQQLFGLVSEAIVRDMLELAPSRLLYKKSLKETDRTNLRKFVFERTSPGASSKTFKYVPHLNAYGHYINRILGNKERRDERERHVDAFFSRYPRLSALLDIKYQNAINNVRESVTRLASDWAIVMQYFFGSRSLRLHRIIGTGNDSHKGGRQVLIFEFIEPATRKAKFQGKEAQRLVYKPSDVEVDYAIAGDNGPQLKTLIKKFKNRGLPIFRPSFFQLVNAALELDAPPHGRGANTPEITLPTYKILPIHPGSQLPRNRKAMPLHDSYGYIEYLSHEPFDSATHEIGVSHRPAYLTSLHRKEPAALKSSDVVASNDVEVRTFYRVWGRLIAAAFILQATDLHQENQIVHRKKPCLIDLENTMVKPLKDATGSMIPARLAKFESADPETVYEIATASTSTIPFGPKTSGAGPRRVKASKNQLYSVEPSAPGAKKYVVRRANPAVYWFMIELGVRETLETVRRHKASFSGWIKEPANKKLIVRHVPIATMEYYNRLQAFISAMLGSDADDKRVQRTLERLKKDTRDTKTEALSATEAETHSWKDYRNLDIPSYYRSVDNKKMLNARGVPVKSGPRATNYFPQTGGDLYEAALKRCLTKRNATFNGFVEEQVRAANRELFNNLSAVITLDRV